jgi:hypothetical protein
MAMEKNKNYAPYLFGAVLTTSAIIANKLYLKPFFLPIGAVYWLVLVGLWHLIDAVLRRFEGKWWRWVCVLLAANLYICAITFLDGYVLHLFTDFVGIKLSDLYAGLFVSAFIATIFIESMNWTRKREKAQIEHLTLQTEHIEAKLNALKKQINPDFLFYSLRNLQTMARAEDPNMETCILKLATVYRHFLQKNKNAHRLHDELALLDAYMLLIRYGRAAAITFDVQISAALLERKIPVFALQYLADSRIVQCGFSASDFSESAEKIKTLHISVFEKDAHSICMTHNYSDKMAYDSIDIAPLAERYALEGVENGVHIDITDTICTITLILL